MHFILPTTQSLFLCSGNPHEQAVEMKLVFPEEFGALQILKPAKCRILAYVFMPAEVRLRS